MPGGLKDEIKLMTEAKLVDHLVSLSKNKNDSQTERAITRMHLGKIAAMAGSGGDLRAHRAYLNDKIQAFLKLPEEFIAQQPLSVPDGAPIGMENLTCDFEF